MRLFDYSTMPIDQAIMWDPNTIAGQAITTEDWIGVTPDEKEEFLAKMNCGTNDNTFLSKLIDLDCFMAVILRGSEVYSQIIVLEDFQRFMRGPIIEGPYNWPDNKS